jgi:hypothetical protein
MGMVQIQSGCGKKCRRINGMLELMERFENTVVGKILKERWKDKDMEAYFQMRSVEHKRELMESLKRLTIRDIRRWMFDFDYLALHVGGMELDNTDGRRYLYELPDQDVEVSIKLEGNTIIIG